jgi:hypothetical protein
MSGVKTSPIPWYPVAFAATYVLNLWVDSGVSVMAVTRSLAVAIAGTAVLLLLTAAVTRRRHLAGIVALVVLLLLLSRGLLYTIGVIVLVVAAGLAALQWGRIRRRPITWAEVTSALNIVCGLLLVVVLAGGVLRGTFVAAVTDIQQGSGTFDASTGERAEAPSIYVLLLDGYPRADSYERLFGADNQAFLEALEGRGFEVAEESESNYMFTQLTLTSMFQMQPLTHIAELDPVAAGTSVGNLPMRRLINDNPVFDFLRDRGYRIVTSSPGYEHVTLRQADVYLDEGQVNEFEYQLLRFTTAQRVVNFVAPDFFADQQRDRIRSGFEHFSAVVTGDSRPTFGFIHVPSPHLPVVFRSDGSDAYLPPSDDIFDWAEIDPVTGDAYVDQLAFINRRVLDLLDQALANDAPGGESVIIVMSDHGAAPRPPIFVGEGTDDHYASFFAARTPGRSGVFGDTITPINVFPRLFNTYFGTDLDEWPDERYPWAGAR